MNNQIQYTTVDRILAKVRRDYGLDQSHELDIIEWIGEALEAIGVVNQYEEAVAFIEVDNHQAVLPNGLHRIVQVAKNHCHNQRHQGCCPTDIFNDPKLWPDGLKLEPNYNPLDTPPAYVPVVLDCNGSPVDEVHLAYYRPYFDLKYEYQSWSNSIRNRDCFRPVRLANNTFFNSIVCREKESKETRELVNHFVDGYQDEYTIINGAILRFSFPHGQIALSYLRQVLDEETGYPMVPDHYSYNTALSEYVNYKVHKKAYFAGRDGEDRKYKEAEQNWQFYCLQAKNYAFKPKGVDDYQNLLDQRNYLIPRVNSYNSFFGKLGRPEDRHFDNPDDRNKYRYGLGFFRGQTL